MHQPVCAISLLGIYLACPAILTLGRFLCQQHFCICDGWFKTWSVSYGTSPMCWVTLAVTEMPVAWAAHATLVSLRSRTLESSTFPISYASSVRKYSSNSCWDLQDPGFPCLYYLSSRVLSSPPSPCYLSFHNIQCTFKIHLQLCQYEPYGFSGL